MIVSVIKPIGPTSFDVVARVRKISGIKKVGHAGTLDPLASGVLVVAIGRESTKKINELMDGDKEYEAEIMLGEYSETDDREGKKTRETGYQIPDMQAIKEALKQFVGTISQTPPLYSAVKVKGKRAYEYGRQGKSVELKPRKVTINDINLVGYKWPKLTIKITCGKGVYIRSLARDIGRKLGTGGYMSRLVRTRVGKFTLENSMQYDELDLKISELIKNSPQV